MKTCDTTFFEKYFEDFFEEYLSDIILDLEKYNKTFVELLARQKNLLNKNENLKDILENHKLFSLSEKEVEVLNEYLLLEDEIQQITEKKYFYRG